MDFRIPSLIPQDLQLIQDIVGELPPNKDLVVNLKVEDDSILSSDDDDAASEKEVEADILGGLDDEEDPIDSSVPSDDSDESSSSDSESESEKKGPRAIKHQKQDEVPGDEDDDLGGGTNISPEQMRTKNEVGEVNVIIPEVEEVGENEVLEKVGEIMSIIDKVVIVKGVASQVQNRGSEKALDSDTLLVFEDRKVLGYIWETFGPTSQPFYRVQFNDAYPLDTEKVLISRPVFHIPARSHFIFVGLLKQIKGSDASNAHDEEPAEDELEFSDDEAEREHKRSLKDRRSGGETPSRHNTPGPSQAGNRDPYMADDLYGADPYDAAYNDIDFGAGPSRPLPMPYDDDPYSDSYGVPEASAASESSCDATTQPSSPTTSFTSSYSPHEHSRGRGRDRPIQRDSGRDRGRGRGQDRRRGDRQRGRGRGRGAEHRAGRYSSFAPDDYSASTGRALSPTSMAIARATGQYYDASNHQNYQQPTADDNWGYQYPGQFNHEYAYQQPYVQPHINPRFASMFGLNMDQGSSQTAQNAYGQGNVYGGGSWSDQWAAPGGPPRPHQRDNNPSHDRY